MFEREIKFIYDFNLNKVNRLGPYFTFEQLLASDIHPAILQYISAEIDYLIYEDRQKLLKNSLFDYSGEKISFHFNQISEEAKKSKRFAQEYIAKLILHASSFTINYLVRPKWTLTKFVFDEDTTKSTNDIKQILNYVYYYKYVNKILVSYINSKKILSMNVQEFEDLLNKADKLGVETYLPAILTNALKSMAEFFNIGEIQKTKIPLSAVEMFLEEKELMKHLQKVNEVFGAEEGVKFNLNDYQKIFSNVVVEKEELIAEPEEPQKFETEEVEEKRGFADKLQSGEDKTEEETDELKKEYEEITEEETEQFDENVQDDEHGKIPEEEEKPELEGNQDEVEFCEPEEDEDRENVNISEDMDEDEITEQVTGHEIKITQPVKFRIRINEDSRIEPVETEPEESIKLSLPADEIDEEKDEQDEIEDEELIEESAEEENENEEKPIGELDFGKEFKLAEKEFEDNDESFLQSLRDQKDDPGTLQGDENKPVQTLNRTDIAGIDESTEPEEAFERSPEAEETKEEDEQERVIFINQMNDNGAYGPDADKVSVEQSKMDMAEILEHKEMTKIIEVIFDYDIEDFAATLDEISDCKNEDDAHIVINNTLLDRHINRTSKEAQTFRAIISEFFGNK